jgi:hypothetical protein
MRSDGWVIATCWQNPSTPAGFTPPMPAHDSDHTSGATALKVA